MTNFFNFLFFLSLLNYVQLNTDATMKEIKKAYRSLARELHPDKGGDPVKFMDMQEAFERLKIVMEKREGRKNGRKGKSDRQERSDQGSDAADAEREAERAEKKQKREDQAKLKEAGIRTAQKRQQSSSYGRKKGKKKKKKGKKKNKKRRGKEDL